MTIQTMTNGTFAASVSRRMLLAGSASTALGLSLAGSITSAQAQEKPESSGKVDMAEVLKPGPLPEMQLGKADAPITVVEYMSMTCPHCAHFHATTFDPIKEKYIDTGKVRFIIREFPFDPLATAAFMLARCNPTKAGELATPEQYFPLVSALFKQQVSWVQPGDGDVRKALLQAVKIAGFSQESFNACLTNQKLLDDVNATMQRGAKDFGVNSTPTFIINGEKYSGDMTVENMSALFDGLL